MDQQLTDKELAVIEQLQTGINTPKEIAEALEVTVQSVNSTVTSLVKKELVLKNEDKTIALIEKPEAKQKNAEQEQNQEDIHLLIPYLKEESSGDELLYALRSFAKNFKEKIKVVVIGDKEPWFGDEIIHIPTDLHTITVGGKEVRDPQADVTSKLLTAIATLGIEGQVIISNDDIFLLGETHISDLKGYAYGDLKSAGRKGGTYSDNAIRTRDALAKNNLPTHRYGTHTPVLMDAVKLCEVIEKYKATEKGYLLSSLYFNETLPTYRPIQVNGGLHDSILASVYKSKVQIEPLHTAIQTRKFLNCNTEGYKAVEPFLKSIFPEKSKYEN